MKKSIVSALIVVLVAISIISVMRESDVKSVATDLKQDNKKIQESVTGLQKELEDKNATIEKLTKEIEELNLELSELKAENGLLRTAIDYKDFTDAIATVESFKSAKTFEETREFLLLARGLSFEVPSEEGKCPCKISFNGIGFEWVPNAVQELKEFRIEEDKIFLTYNTKDDIKHTYQFVMAKGVEPDQIGKWRIKLITRDNK